MFGISIGLAIFVLVLLIYGLCLYYTAVCGIPSNIETPNKPTVNSDANFTNGYQQDAADKSSKLKEVVAHPPSQQYGSSKPSEVTSNEKGHNQRERLTGDAPSKPSATTNHTLPQSAASSEQAEQTPEASKTTDDSSRKPSESRSRSPNRRSRKLEPNTVTSVALLKDKVDLIGDGYEDGRRRHKNNRRSKHHYHDEKRRDNERYNRDNGRRQPRHRDNEVQGRCCMM